MKTLFFAWACLLLRFAATAQGNIFDNFQYEPGYLVTNKGDTLRGLIKYTRQYELSLRVQFREEKSRDAETYRPFSIRSFWVKNETYESKIYDYAPERADGFAVFMRRMNTGYCKVYEYWNSDKERGFTQTFIEKPNKSMEEVQFFEFKRQMQHYFNDFPQLVAKIKRNVFQKKDLLKIVAEYNEWKERGW